MSRLFAGMMALFVAACVASATGTAWAVGTGPGGPVSAKTPPSIEWREWSRGAFDEAKAKHKLVLLDITAFWCHWCRVMDEESYTDSAVVAEITANFIPIRVDYDLRPDIGDRYLTNGWPTTGVLSADGHLLLSKTYLPPITLQDFLREAVLFYRMNREQVDRRVAEAEKAVAKTWEPDSLLAPTISDEEYIDQTIDALVASEDKVHGGFGTAPKTARWDAISFLLRAADARRDDDLRALAVRGAVAALALQDSVDGGFFRFALQPDWTKIRYERLLDEQAKALSVLTRVYRATGEKRFKKAADRVEEFALSNLFARMSHGSTLWKLGWRHSVGPDVRLRQGGWMEGDVYFRLSRGARRRTGRLEESQTFTTDAAARMSSALLSRDRSLKASFSGRSRLPAYLMRSERGGYYHSVQEDRRSGVGFLADHAVMGNAILDEYESRRQESRLSGAESLAIWIRANLEDPLGGFRYAPRDTSEIGRLRAGDKPEASNVEAATFFLRLYWLTGQQQYREVAERTARYLQSGDKIVLDPARAELVLRLREEPVRLLVISGDDEKKARRAWDLGAAALEAPVSEVVVRYMPRPPKSRAPGAWPDGAPPDAKSPAIYRWTTKGWLGPVTDPARLGEILDKPTVEP